MFSKPNAIIYVRRGGLVVAGKRVPPARLAFPEELVQNMEVMASDKFITGCQDFFSTNNLHGKRVLMVLDAGIIFTKNFELDKASKPKALAQAFIDAMPFESGKRACIIMRQAERLRLFATNAELYGALAEALHQTGIAKLLAITPASAYDLGNGQLQFGAAIEHFIDDRDVRSAANFIDVNPA